VAGLLRLNPQPLDRIHDVLLLSEKGISQSRRPGNVIAHTPEDVRKHDERLDTRIPVLLLGGLSQRRSRQPRIPLEPLRRLDHFQRVCRSDKHLA
jgi:hypothetical protein